MDVITEDKHLEKLYKEGSSKKLKLPEQVVKKFFMRIDAIQNANTIYDLWKNPSMNFEKLEGFENRYSIRLNRQYRLEAEVTWENEERTKGIFHLKKISKHYEK